MCLGSWCTNVEEVANTFYSASNYVQNAPVKREKAQTLVYSLWDYILQQVAGCGSLQHIFRSL